MSAAGVLMELLLILVMLIPYHIFAASGAPAHPTFWNAYTFLIYLNIFAIVINLLPIPGLDGFGIIEPYLPFHIVERAYKILPYTFWILLLILIVPNPIRWGINLAVSGLSSLAGLGSPGRLFGLFA